MRIRPGRRHVSAPLGWSLAAVLTVTAGIAYYAGGAGAVKDDSESSVRTRTCAHGFRDDGNSCVAVKLPLNASLVRAGDDWKCDAHFVKRGSACVPARGRANAPTDSNDADENCGPGSTRKDSPPCGGHSRPQTSSAIAVFVLAALRSLQH